MVEICDCGICTGSKKIFRVALFVLDFVFYKMFKVIRGVRLNNRKGFFVQ